MEMNENVSNQLITRIINKLSGVKPFINMVDFNNYGEENSSVMMYEGDSQVKYECSTISVSVKDLEFNLDNYNLVIHLLDKIMLELTMNIESKNYYLIEETIEEDIIKVMNKLDKVTWFMTFDTHLELLTMLDPNDKLDNWRDFRINGKKINTMESSFPKSLIFGSEHPIIINPELLKSELFDDINTTVIRIPFFYTNDFYAMKLISDEQQKKIILRNKKIKKIRN